MFRLFVQVWHFLGESHVQAAVLTGCLNVVVFSKKSKMNYRRTFTTF